MKIIRYIKSFLRWIARNGIKLIHDEEYKYGEYDEEYRDEEYDTW